MFEINKQKVWGRDWLVVAIGVAIAILGIHVGEIDDAPGAALIGILLMIAILFTFGYWKGEKPRWQWGLSKERDRRDQ